MIPIRANTPSPEGACGACRVGAAADVTVRPEAGVDVPVLGDGAWVLHIELAAAVAGSDFVAPCTPRDEATLIMPRGLLVVADCDNEAPDCSAASTRWL